MRHALGQVTDFNPDSGREFTIEDRIVAVFRVKDDFYALDGVCPHAGGPLGDGCLVGTRVTCPWHGWQFDVTTGQHGLTPHIVQESFPVVVENGTVFVDLPEV